MQLAETDFTLHPLQERIVGLEDQLATANEQVGNWHDRATKIHGDLCDALIEKSRIDNRDLISCRVQRKNHAINRPQLGEFTIGIISIFDIRLHSDWKRTQGLKTGDLFVLSTTGNSGYRYSNKWTLI